MWTLSFGSFTPEPDYTDMRLNVVELGGLLSNSFSSFLYQCEKCSLHMA